MSAAPKKKIPIKAPTSAEFAAHVARVKEGAAQAEKERQEELMRNLKPGQRVGGQGVYVGQYKPKDRDGKSLGKTFNVFAAPEDLPGMMKYMDAVKYLSALKGWYGFDGCGYKTDKEIYAALKGGSYNGGWIIPTRDILHGNDVDGKATTPDNLRAHKDKGALKDTFKTAVASGFDWPEWYWSSTEYRDYSTYMHGICFSNGNAVGHSNDYNRLNCRPVRLVEVKP